MGKGIPLQSLSPQLVFTIVIDQSITVTQKVQNLRVILDKNKIL